MLPRSLRLSLVLLATVPAFCLLLVVLITTTFARLDEQITQHDSSARQMTSQFAASIDYALISNQPALLDSSLNRLMDYPGVVSVRILDQRGLLWLSRGDLSRKGRVQRFSARVERARPVPDPSDWLSADQSADEGGEIIGKVEIAFDVASLWRREWAIFFQLALIGLSALIFIAIVAWLAATSLSRQLARVQADEARQRHLSRELLQEREQRWLQEQERQQAWGKWSHDIRTPLHGVSGMLELLSGTELDAEQQNYLGQAREASRAMEDSLRNSPLPPAVTRALGDSQVLAEAEAHWRGKRVLLVEDDLISQHLLRGILEPWGVTLVCVGCGQEALALRQQAWDLVMVDGELPDMNAATLAQAWTAGQPLGKRLRRQGPPLVAITAHSDPEHIERYRAAGLDPVLNKPLRRSHLLSVLTPLIAAPG